MDKGYEQFCLVWGYCIAREVAFEPVHLPLLASSQEVRVAKPGGHQPLVAERG